MTISGKTRVCGVIGDPIKHTLSPAIQNAAFDHLKLDFIFLAFRVRASKLESAIEGMKSLDIHGLNVTMPHKNKVTNYLDELDPTSKLFGSVNTILNKKNKLFGFNTDGVGALQALRKNDVILEGRKVLLLGAGGAAKAIACSLAPEVGALVILNRTPKKAKEIATTLEREIGERVESAKLSINTLQNNLRDSDVLINATNIGMAPNIGQRIIPKVYLKPDLTVMDIIYNPVETRLIKDAKASGAKVINGFDMLIYQGAKSFEIWTGCPAPIEVMSGAAFNRLSNSGVDG